MLEMANGSKDLNYFTIKKSFSIYFKILMNYLQMIAIIHSLDLRWPFYVSDYFSFIGRFGSAAGDIISLDCLIKDYNLEINNIHLKSIVVIIFTILIIFFFGMILLIIRLKTKNNQRNRFFIICIIISIFLQPTILQILFDNLNYTNLNNTSYLTKNLLIKYYDEDHQEWVLSFIP